MIPAGDSEHRPRIPRSVGIVAALACGVAGSLVLLAIVVDILDLTLPTGRRSPVGLVAPSDQQSYVGSYWYTAAQAEALSAELAAATEGTDWCLGWSIVLAGSVPYEDITGATSYGGGPGSGTVGTDLDGGFGSGYGSGFGEYADVGSSEGPGESARRCREWAEVEVVYEYTSSTSEQEDNAEMTVRSSDLAVASALGDHPAVVLSPDDLLHEDRGDNGDDVIANSIAAMPLVLAEEGRLDPLSVEPVAPGTEGAVTFEDSEGEGGIDMLVTNRTPLLVGALVVLAGLLLLCMALAEVPASWFRPAAASPPSGLRGMFTSGRAAGPTGNPRRALKQQLERARQTGRAQGGRGGS